MRYSRIALIYENKGHIDCQILLDLPDDQKSFKILSSSWK